MEENYNHTSEPSEPLYGTQPALGEFQSGIFKQIYSPSLSYAMEMERRYIFQNIASDADKLEREEQARRGHRADEVQDHTHEFLGSVEVSGKREPHIHKFAGVTGQAIPMGNNNHYHFLKSGTDNFDDHSHELADSTGPAIHVGNDTHVHYLKGRTDSSEGHVHNYRFITQIETPFWSYAQED